MPCAFLSIVTITNVKMSSKINILQLRDICITGDIINYIAGILYTLCALQCRKISFPVSFLFRIFRRLTTVNLQADESLYHSNSSFSENWGRIGRFIYIRKLNCVLQQLKANWKKCLNQMIYCVLY